MRRLTSARLLGLLAIGGAATACSSGSTAPRNPGDTVFVDVEASTAPPPPKVTDADTDPDGVFDPVDSSGVYGHPPYDASAVLSICAPPDGSAGSTTTADGGAKAATEAGAKTATGGGGEDAASSSGGAIYAAADAGCTPFPAVCMSQPDCTCLLGMLASEISCTYPRCGVNLDHSGFSIYCP